MDIEKKGFKEGDIVHLRSGGPRMLVTKVVPLDEGAVVTVVWASEYGSFTLTLNGKSLI